MRVSELKAMRTSALKRLAGMIENELWRREQEEAERQRELQAKRDAVTVVSERTVDQFIKCGKAGCHCAKGKGHGPYTYNVITTADGRSRKKYQGKAA